MGPGRFIVGQPGESRSVIVGETTAIGIFPAGAFNQEDTWLACEHPERPPSAGLMFHVRSYGCHACDVAFDAWTRREPDSPWRALFEAGRGIGSTDLR